MLEVGSIWKVLVSYIVYNTWMTKLIKKQQTMKHCILLKMETVCGGYGPLIIWMDAEAWKLSYVQ